MAPDFDTKLHQGQREAISHPNGLPIFPIQMAIRSDEFDKKLIMEAVMD